VIADIGVWRTVNLLLELHGNDAAIFAAQRADELRGRLPSALWFSAGRLDWVAVGA
jgi:hypothetical protein